MGIVNWLDDTWDDIYDSSKKSWDESTIGGAVQNFYGGLGDMMMSGFSREENQSWWDAFSQGFGRSVSAYGQVPVLGSALAAYDRLWTRVVKRPVATVFYASAASPLQEDAGYAGLKSFFTSGRLWSDAWDKSEYVTPGQAFTWGFANQFRSADEAIYADPAGPNRRAVYYDDPWFKWTSGALDFSFSFVGIPGANAATKAGGVSRLTRGATVTDKTLASGGIEKAIASPRFENFRDQSMALSSSELEQLAFNNYAQGGTLSAIFADAGDRLARGEITDADFAELYRAAAGDRASLDRILAREPAASAAIGTNRNAINITRTIDQAGTDPVATEALTAQRDATVDAYVSDWVRDIRELGTFEAAFVGQRLPKITGVDQARLSFRNFALGRNKRAEVRRKLYEGLQPGVHRTAVGLAIKVGAIPRGVAKMAQPTIGSSPWIDMNRAESYRDFRANLEHSRLTTAEVQKFVSDYIQAGTPAARQFVLVKADHAAVWAELREHGVTWPTYQSLVGDVDRMRHASRAMRSGSTMQLPKKFRDAANKAIREGRRGLARRLTQFAEAYEAEVAAGNLPESISAFFDGDGNLNLSSLGESGGAFKPTDPLSVTGVADWLPMTDYRDLRSAAKWYMAPQQRTRTAELAGAKGTRADVASATAFHYGAYTVQVAQTLKSWWSIAATFGLRTPMRNIAEGVMRRMAMFGAMDVFLGGLKGFARSPYNVTTGGRLWAEVQLDRWRRSAAPVIATGQGGYTVTEHTPVTPIAATAPTGGVRQGYGYANGVPLQRPPVAVGNTQFLYSYDQALAAGAITSQEYWDYTLDWYNQGRLPTDETSIIDRYKNRSITTQQAFLETLEYSLAKQGLAAYAAPKWQDDVLSQVVRARPRGGRKRLFRVDPYNGTVESLRGRAVASASKVRPGVAVRIGDKGTSRRDMADALYDSIKERLPHLLDRFYDTNFHLVVNPDRSIDVQFLLPSHRPDRRQTTAAPGAALTPKGRMRTWAQDKSRRSGTLPIVVKDSTGAVRHIIQPGFAGKEGDWARNTVSSRGTMQSYANLISTRNGDRWLGEGTRRGWRAIKPTDTNYDAAWEREVNAKLGGDPVYHKFLEGKTEAQVMAWVESPEGRAWVRQLPEHGSFLWERVRTMGDYVKYLVPNAPALRAKVLAQDATVEDLRAAVPRRQDWPEVQGQDTEWANGAHPLSQWVKRRLDGFYRVFHDLPTDKLVNFPYFNSSYTEHARTLVQSYLDSTERTGKFVDVAEVERLQHMARERAISDVKNHLYDASFRTDAARMLDGLVPFTSAIADGVYKWARIARERPLQTLHLWNQMYYAPERAGLVEDQDGNKLVLRNGKETWVDPFTGEPAEGEKVGESRYIIFPLPDTLTPAVYGPGAKPVVRVPKDTLKALFNPLEQVPGAGPWVAIPVNEFVINRPQYDNKFVRTFILPFGPRDSKVRMFLPGTVGSFYDNFIDDDSSKADSYAMTYFQTQLTRFRLGERREPPTLEEARQVSLGMRWLRWVQSGTSPVSSQYLSPYEPYQQAYRRLVVRYGDEREATQQFIDLYGHEYLAMTASVTRNIGIRASMNTYDVAKRQRDLIDKYPDLAGLITGEQSDPFNQAVYEWQKGQYDPTTGKPWRDVQPIAESIRDVYEREAWTDYSKFMDGLLGEMRSYGIHSLDDAAAAPLRKRRAEFIAERQWAPTVTGAPEYSEFFTKITTYSGAQTDERLAQMRGLTAEKDVNGRDDISGIADYLMYRDQVRLVMKQLGWASLDTQQAQGLKRWWESTVYDLVQRNPSFGAVHSRWLYNDVHLEGDGMATL